VSPSGFLTVVTPGIAGITAQIGGQTGVRNVGIPGAIDGEWRGTTSQGSAVAFTVRYATIDQVNVGGGSCGGTFAERALVGSDSAFQMRLLAGQFTVSGIPIDIFTTLTGLFGSETTMTGSIGGTSCGSNRTYSATKQ
jgi:hypothetical protein